MFVFLGGGRGREEFCSPLLLRGASQDSKESHPKLHLISIQKWSKKMGKSSSLGPCSNQLFIICLVGLLGILIKKFRTDRILWNHMKQGECAACADTGVFNRGSSPACQQRIIASIRAWSGWQRWCTDSCCQSCHFENLCTSNELNEGFLPVFLEIFHPGTRFDFV